MLDGDGRGKKKKANEMKKSKGKIKRKNKHLGHMCAFCVTVSKTAIRKYAH